MKWRLFNVLAAVSLVAMLLELGVWVLTRNSLARIGHTTLSAEERADGLHEKVLFWDLVVSAGGLNVRRLHLDFTPDHAPEFPAGWGLFAVSKYASYPVLFLDSGKPRPTFAGFQLVVDAGRIQQTRFAAVDGTFRDWSFTAPLWAVAIVFAIVPTINLIRLTRRKRQDGSCDVCGYDLRATPERCPECGVAPENHPAAITSD